MELRLHSHEKLDELTRSGKLDELVDCCRQNLDRIRGSLERDDLKIAFTLEDLARAYDERGAFSDSAEELLKALQIISNCGEPTLPYLRCLNKLGRTYLLTDRLHEAKVTLQRVLETSVSEDHEFSRTIAMKHLAGVRMEERDFRGAHELLIAAFRYQARELGNHPILAGTLFDLARLYGHRQRFRDAERLVLKSLKILRDAGETESVDYAIRLSFLGLLNGEKGDYAEATLCHSSAVDILRKIRPAGHYELRAVERRLSEAQHDKA